MSKLTDERPPQAYDLIQLLDEEIKPAIVKNREDVDLFELGKQAGKRELVDQIKRIYERRSDAGTL